MIDREARNDLAALVRRYLNDEIKSSDLDESLLCFGDSRDSAVRFVAHTMWYHYDDFTDHFIVASKPEWNYFQRLLLLLESNSTVEHEHHRQWSITQLIAGLLLAACAGIVWQFGFGWHLLIFFLPFGVASIVLSRFRRSAFKTGPFKAILSPFSSIEDLRVAYESARNFRKRQFPKHIQPRLVRSPSPFLTAFGTCYMYLMWALIAPLPLLVQCTPISFRYPIVKPG